MINLRIRTEYSFGLAYGPLAKVIEAVGDSPALAVTDRHGTWSHVAFSKAMSKAGKAPIFGVELAIVEKIERERHPANYMAFLARNNAGLQELYELVTEATADGNFYYFPRLDYHRVKSVSQNLIVLSGTNPIWDLLNQKQKNLYIELSPSSRRTAVDFARASKRPLVATSDNYYPTFEHKAVYEIIAGRNRDSRTTPMHILDQWEWMNYWPEHEAAWKLTAGLAAECTATIPKAQNVKYNSPKTLEQMCIEAAPARRIDLANSVYKARLRRELDMIAEKDFADYFFVIADMLQYAKKHMMVGPARGSSCGSLVCYLLSITEIDPIPFDLLFERFIDINRKDLPDIDIDFADDRRDMVFDYVRNKYGDNCVARLGTIMRYKAKSAIDAVAVSLRIDKAKTENLKGSIIERSGGDARAAFCILDTFNELEVGKEMLREFPHLRIAADIENHAKTTGQHAAGIVITQEPISRFCSMNLQSGAVMVDKFDAESVNLLKIDALGLRTLSVIQDCLDQIGKSREWLMEYPFGDEDAFDVVNNSRFAGIFQFEGYALQSLCQQMRVENFEDIASLGALARPGPLNSGGANEFIKRRTGQHPVEYLHPLCKEMTEVTYGTVIYQEQVMTIARVIGQLSWEDVSSLRKAMSKSMGVEFFDKFWVRFLEGAIKQGISEPEARKVWEQINSMGSWCLAGDTRIRIGRAGNGVSQNPTIEELYNQYIESPSPWIRFMKHGGPVVVSMHPDGRCYPQRTFTIHKNRIKPLIKLTFADGSEVRCTKEHRFLINGRWRRAGTAKVGDSFTSSGYEMIKFNFKGGNNGRNKGKKYIKPQLGFPKGKANINFDNGRTPEAIAFKKKMADKPCQVCNKEEGRKEVHHKDNRAGELRPKDLAWLCVSCHKKAHYKLGRTKIWEKGHKTFPLKLTKIMDGGRSMTYDLEMPEHHNFALANGVITHNSFNRSHAVAYGMVTYWCMVLKAHWPLEWAVACLRNASSDDQCIKLLRELDSEGFKYRDFDPELSKINWSVHKGELIGGLLNVKGIGAKKAKDVMERRADGRGDTPAMKKMLTNAQTPFSYDKVFECRVRFGPVLACPTAFNIHSKIWRLIDITSEMEGDFVFFGKMVKKDLRDLNEPLFIQKRGGEYETGQTLFLNMTVEDDTSSILTSINRRDYLDIGKPIVEIYKIGDWFLWKGRMRKGFRKVYIQRYWPGSKFDIPFEQTVIYD